MFEEIKNEKDQSLIKFYLGIITTGKFKNSNKNKRNIILKKSGNITKKLNFSFIINVAIYFIKIKLYSIINTQIKELVCNKN